MDKLERIEVEQDDLSGMHFRFPPAPHSGKVSIRAKKIAKNYGDLEVLKHVDLEVERGEKIAFVGKNGEGKTTLAKIIVDELDSKGEVVLGHQVKLGYYAQNQSDLLDENKTILQVIEDAADEQSRPRVRDMLGSFLFGGEAVDKKIKVLSGGERARVALCKLLLEPANLLVMDEPTNHLDMKSKDILKSALNGFDGTLIIVSHDRDFLQGLTEKVYEFKDRNIKEYLGDVNAFLEAKMVENFKDFELRNPAEKSPFEKEISANKLSYEERKKLDKDIRKLSNKVAKLEREVDALEQELKRLDVELANPEKFQEMSKKEGFFKEYQQKQQKLSSFMDNWETSLEELESKTEARSQF